MGERGTVAEGRGSEEPSVQLCVNCVNCDYMLTVAVTWTLTRA